jgi:hypothetical protein
MHPKLEMAGRRPGIGQMKMVKSRNSQPRWQRFRGSRSEKTSLADWIMAIGLRDNEAKWVARHDGRQRIHSSDQA